MNTLQVEGMLVTSPLSVKWFRFYVYWRFPITILLLMVSLIYNLANYDFSIFSTTEYVIIFYQFVFSRLVHIVFAFLTMWHMLQLNPTGYVLNWHYLFFESYCYGLSQMYYFTDSKYIQLSFFLSAFGWFIFFAYPNLKYFHKRSYLFYGEEHYTYPIKFENTDSLNPSENDKVAAFSADAIKSSDTKIKRKVFFCKKCGSSVDTDTKKCTGCGNQYFRIPRLSRSGFVILLLSFLLCASIGVSIIQSIRLSGAQESYRLSETSYSNVWDALKNKEADVRALKARSTALQNNLTKLQSKSDVYKKKADFLDSNIAIYTKTGTKIHKLDCHHLNNVDWVYYMSIEEALSRGYTYCADCK